MVNLQVAFRYAKSLLELAIQQNITQAVHTDMLLFSQLCADHEELLIVFKNPLVANDQKYRILHQLLANKVTSLVLQFFDMVIQKKNRATILSDITTSFLAQYNQYQGIKIAHITTIFPLSDSLVDGFKKLVHSIVACQEVQLIHHLTPAILGGFILQVDDKRIDASLMHKLNLLKNQCITHEYE